MPLNGGRSCCECRKEAQSSRHQEDFNHVLGNQNRSCVSSFIRQQTRGGRGEEKNLRQFLEANNMLRNPVVCYSIATELKPKFPTCTQLMSFLALRKKTWERSVLNHNVCRLGTTKRTHTSIFALLCLLQGIALVKFYCFAHQVCREIVKLITFLASRDLILNYCASILDACEFRGSRIELRIETRKRLSTYI